MLIVVFFFQNLLAVIICTIFSFVQLLRMIAVLFISFDFNFIRHWPKLLVHCHFEETSRVSTKGVLGRITIPFAVDSTQEEALCMLKKLEV